MVTLHRRSRVGPVDSSRMKRQNAVSAHLRTNLPRDFTVTLLLLQDRDRYVQLESEPEEDTYDRFMRHQ
jgi:hypothetical protein